MKEKRFLLMLCLISALVLVSGCMAGVSNPLSKVEATPLPGSDTQLHAASASETNVDEIQVSLYYRYLEQPMLGAETRILTVPRDETTEFAIVKALLEGPSAGYGGLRRLFPDTVTVESVIPRQNILFVTFSEALLTGDGIPADWAQQEQWASEAPLRRKLTIQSLVASITENFSYTGVQVLVRQTTQAQTSFRLDNSYFLDGTSGLSEPMIRDESLLLTPQNTGKLLLNAWQSRDFATLYAFVTNAGQMETLPSFQEVAQELDGLSFLIDFTVLGGGSISGDGQKAVLTVKLTLSRDGEQLIRDSYPLSLVRENGLWRIRYAELQRLMTL